VADGVVVFHVFHRIRESEQIIFWDIKTTQVYSHRAIEGTAAVGCTGVEEAASQERKARTLLNIQGVGKREPHRLGTSTDISIHNTLEQKSCVDRLKNWNLGAMLFFLLLTALNGLFIFSASDSEIFLYYKAQYIRMLLFFLICVFAAKAALPPLTVRWSWQGVYGIAYPALTVCWMVLCLAFPYAYTIYSLSRSLAFLSIPFFIVYILHSRYSLVKTTFPILVLGIMLVFTTFLVNRPSNIYYLELHFLLIAVIVLTLRIRIRKRPQFIRVMAVYLVCFITVALVLLVLGRGIKPEELYWKIAQPEQYAQVVEYCRNVWASAKWIGPAEVPAPVFFTGDYVDDFTGMWSVYIGSYFLNYVLREYGLLPACGCVLLVLGTIIFMLIGVKKQECTLDRCICMSCTLFLLLETVLAVFASVGLQVIPPNCVPFLSGCAHLYRGSYMALCIYMAFYRAHKQVK